MEDIISLTTLPMHGESNRMGVVLEEDDEEKLQCLTFAMAVWWPLKRLESQLALPG